MSIPFRPVMTLVNPLALNVTLVSSLLLCLSACGSVSAIRNVDAPTVATVADANGRTSDGWFVVRTTSTLRVDAASEVEPDPQQAIANYDRLLQLDAPPRLRAEALRRSADLRLQGFESGEGDTADLQAAAARYQTLLAEFPEDRLADRALYQLARAYELLGNDDGSIEALQQLGRRYPDSVRVADARFRAAEKLYLERRYDEATEQYAAAIELGDDAPYADYARYKHGWALYKQARYSEALPEFIALLDRALPDDGEFDSSNGLFDRVESGRADMARDALRVTGLCFAALGGGTAINDYLSAQDSEPRFTPALYAALGEQLLDRRRYTDAAETYTAFIDTHPRHRLAPEFQAQAVAAYQAGGFRELLMASKRDYVEAFAPGADYWQDNAPSETVLATVREDLDQLASESHARAQTLPQGTDETVRRAAFAEASGWYEKALTWFPDDANAAATRLLYADSLLEAGHTAQAAGQYSRLMRDAPNGEHAPEAGLAAAQAWQQLAREVPSTQRAEALKASIAASLEWADRYPEHPELARVLTRAAEDRFELKDYEGAIELSQRVLALSAPASLQATALGVRGDAEFTLERYADAEASYTRLLATGANETTDQQIEQLAAAVYKQGEMARDAEDLRAAAEAFARVGRVAPTASIRAAADYDAAMANVGLEDWPLAEQQMEAFRRRHIEHVLLPDVDKKLAFAYQQDDKLAAAAEVYARIAQRNSEAPSVRREAAWLSAELAEQGGRADRAEAAYERYVEQYPQPLLPALQARQRLADLALQESGNGSRHVHWLDEILSNESAGGRQRSDETHLIAARAALKLGRLDSANARSVSLRAPIEKSLDRRKLATEKAIATLSRASSFGFAEVSTAATYEIANVYRDFGKALIESERPRGLDALAQEQYELLLEEQAYPFEEKAIAAYEVNLQRLREGLWDEWIRRSSHALGEIVPARYGKQEQRDMRYESLL